MDADEKLTAIAKDTAVLRADLTALRELVDARFNAAAEALKLQTDINKDHFDLLNHENARTAEWQSKCVSVDVYRAEHKALSDRVAELSVGASETRGRGSGILTAVTVGIALLAIVVSLWGVFLR